MNVCGSCSIFSMGPWTFHQKEKRSREVRLDSSFLFIKQGNYIKNGHYQLCNFEHFSDSHRRKVRNGSSFVLASHLRSSSFGWFLLSRLRSMRSDSRCFRTSVAYSNLLCSTVMIREATFPRSLMEKPRWASRVRIKHSRKTLLLMSWPKSFSPFSTCSWR